MPQHSATWKMAEKKAAQILGGERISGPRGVKMQDIEHHLFSVEVKHGKSCIPKFVTKAYNQAKTNAPKGKIPLVVLHNHGSTEYMALLPLPALAALIDERYPSAAMELRMVVVTELQDEAQGGGNADSHRQCDEAG